MCFPGAAASSGAVSSPTSPAPPSRLRGGPPDPLAADALRSAPPGRMRFLPALLLARPLHATHPCCLEDTFVLEPGFPGRGSVAGPTEGPSASPRWAAPGWAWLLGGWGAATPSFPTKGAGRRSPGLGGLGSGQARKRRGNLGWDAALGGSRSLPPGSTVPSGGVRRGLSRLEREGVAVSLTWAPAPGKARLQSRGPLPAPPSASRGARRGGPVPSPFALAPAHSALGH